MKEYKGYPEILYSLPGQTICQLRMEGVMEKKTDFYAIVHVYAGKNGDPIIQHLWEARKKVILEPPVDYDLVSQINGALRIRMKVLAPGLKG